jgi:type II secretory pathway pseudopilin PulG
MTDTLLVVLAVALILLVAVRREQARHIAVVAELLDATGDLTVALAEARALNNRYRERSKSLVATVCKLSNRLRQQGAQLEKLRVEKTYDAAFADVRMSMN